MTNSQQDALYLSIAKKLIHQQKNKVNHPLIVGISGAYTSGKTYFTEKVALALQNSNAKVQILHYDDFHLPLSKITWNTSEKNGEILAFYHAFNQKKLVTEVLNPLKTQGTLNATLQKLNWETGSYELPLSLAIEQNTIVLVEGMLLFQETLIPFFDYKIFLSIRDATLLARGKTRDVPRFGPEILTLYRRRYLPVYHLYLEKDSPIEIADVVLDNNQVTQPKILKINF